MHIKSAFKQVKPAFKLPTNNRFFFGRQNFKKAVNRIVIKGYFVSRKNLLFHSYVFHFFGA